MSDYKAPKGSSEEMLIKASFKPGTPVYHFCSVGTLDDLKAALFMSNRNQTVPLTIKLDDDSRCPVAVTQVRPIITEPADDPEADPEGRDIWPDWYVEGDNLAHTQFGKKVRVYFLVVQGMFWDGYIQTIQDGDASRSGPLNIIG